MKDSTDILDYIVHWRHKSQSGIIGELFHIVRNSSGGSISTPIGYLIGFIEPVSEYSSSYWKIILTIREEIRYDTQSKTNYVFVKSAYYSKLKYYAQRLLEFIQDVNRINPGLPVAIKEELIKTGLCSSPIEIQMKVGKDKTVYSNVEFNFDYD
jgi:hypothetical protein